MPVAAMHPPRVDVRRLRPVVNDRAASADAHVFGVPYIDVAKEHRTGREVERLPAMEVDRALMHAGTEPDDLRIVAVRQFLPRRIREEKEPLIVELPRFWMLHRILTRLWNRK